MNEYYKTISPLFSVIKDKTVLEYGCFIGDWWQMFDLHSPKKVTAIDPRRHPDIESNIIKYNHFVDFKQIGYESLEKDTEHDVIVCAGVLYKMSSPFHLIEDIVSRNPEHILFETTGRYEKETQNKISIVRWEDGVSNRNWNKDIKRLQWSLVIKPRTVVEAFEFLGYDFETHINIECEDYPSKQYVSMMKFIRK